MQNLTIQIDMVDYTVPPEVITEQLKSSSGSDVCKILVEYQSNLGNYAYLGLPFLENFVAVYDYPDGIVQFAVSPKAYAGVNVGEGVPWVEYIKQLSGWEIFWIVLFFLVCFVAIIVAIYFFCKCFAQKKDENDARAVLYSQVNDHNSFRAEERKESLSHDN